MIGKTTIAPMLPSGALALGILCAALGVSMSAAAAADINAVCGTKPAKVALVDGIGGNTWRKQTLAELKDEAESCPNITQILYADSGGDAQKYNSDISSFAAQGVNIIVTFTDFGDAGLPAYRSAKKAGVVIVPYQSHLSGKTGRDYDANVFQDQAFIGKSWADWIGETLKSGNIVFLGGTPGAATSTSLLAQLKEGLKAYPDIKLLDPDFIVTNWNPADAQRAMSGVIAKYPKIDGVVSDYGVTTLAAIKAFQQAGLPVPAQATLASNNELNCKYLADKKAGKDWRYFSVDGTNGVVRAALRRAMAIYEGTEDEEGLAYRLKVFADSTHGIEPKCDDGVPPDADLSSSLSSSKLKAALSQ